MKIKSLLLAAVLALTMISSAEAKTPTIDPAWADLPEMEVERTLTGGTLLFSDSPEMVGTSGILYRDTVVGDVRLFLYHVNDTKLPKRILAVVKNEGDRTAHIRVTRWASAEPSEDWLAVGRDVQKNYFGAPRADRMVVGAGETRVLTRHLEKEWIEPNALVHTIHDFHTDQPVTVTVLMMPLYGTPEKFLERANVLPADSSRLRGTFQGTDYHITAKKPYGEKTGLVGITLADNKRDTYIRGIDATDGSAVENYGNYGMVYRIHVPMKSGKLRAYLNPRGGLYAGALLELDEDKAKFLATPSGRGWFGTGTIYDAEDLGTYDERDDLTLVFSPPGASNLPVRIILAPEE